MPKIIIVKSCWNCDLSFNKKVKMGCPAASHPDHTRPKSHIYENCPLPDDINRKALKNLIEAVEYYVKNEDDPPSIFESCLEDLK